MIYRQAAKGITKKWNAYMKEAEQTLSPLEAAYAAAKESGDKEAIKKAGRRLAAAKREVTLQSNSYKQMLSQTTRSLANVNKTALEYVNGQMPNVYVMNFNADDIAAEVKKISTAPANFGLVNERAIRRRITEGDIRLPKKRLAVPKDMAWNTRQLNSSVLQGILQGDSMTDIAKRILPIVGNNESAAIRNARTMTTSAENQGRLDRYKELEEEGAIIKKTWIATADERTRESHLMLDGEEADVDATFSNGLMYPGDPSGEPEEVYNCRCTMGTEIIGFRASDGHIEYVQPMEDESEDLHDKQIEKEREKRDGN